MILPSLSYKRSKVQRQLTAFLGLNLTENTKEGEMRDAYGLSTRSYPCLTQRAARKKVDEYEDITDVFEWDNKLCVVSGGILYYNGNPLDNVVPGKKQFAVINSQILVMPDKLCIDIDKGTYRRLGGTVETAKKDEGEDDAITFTQNTIKASIEPIVKRQVQSGQYYNSMFRTDDQTSTVWAVETFGNGDEDVATVRESLKKNENFSSCVTVAKGLHVFDFYDTKSIEIGDIIPVKKENNSFSIVTGSAYNSAQEIDGDEVIWKEAPNRDAYNTEGFYGIVRDVEIIDDESGQDFCWSKIRIKFDVYSAKKENSPFSDFFRAGDFVDIELTYNNCNHIKDNVKIISIDNSTNTITFPDNTFDSAGNASSVKMSARFPKLDYICVSDNRVWGVSNEDNTIYASALGNPGVFYDYSTLSTASYSLAVASDGDFTGISAFGGTVLCWKEDMLHKIIGDVPSKYQKADYTIAGVANGAHHSIAIINEVLYYKGTSGIYTYTGSTPRLISYNLGECKFSDAVGGSFDNRYYLSAKNATGEGLLFVYDTAHGLWMKEDNVYVDSFAVVGGVLYAVSDGKLLCYSGDEAIPWMAEFVPFTETVLKRKNYTRLLLRMDMEKKAWLRVEIKEDNNAWREVYTHSASDMITLNIPLRVGRCDRFAVRLSGKGRVTIRSMVREVHVGSEV